MTTAVAGATTPTSSQANIDSGTKTLGSSYDTFLTLLTTQLKNQDPTSPLDTNAFTQQLVQMTGVQQQLLSNQLLQQLVSNSGGGGVSGAVGMIGKTATVATADAGLSGGQASWRYSLASNAASANASITDSFGRAVWTGPLSDLGAGDHGFTWNGKDSTGHQLPDGGKYTLAVSAADPTGGDVGATIAVRGQVTGVTQVGDQTMLVMGSTQAPLAQVTSVTGS